MDTSGAPEVLEELLHARAGDAAVDAAAGAQDLEALELITVDEDGWPHVAWLSAGEILPRGSGACVLGVWSASGTARNLRRRGQALLHGVVDGAAATVRLQIEDLGSVEVAGVRLTAFAARATSARLDGASYATALGGPRFRLHEPAPVVARWRDQLAELAAAPGARP